MSRSRELLVTEIFHSLQGESTSVGIPTVFVRLTGCPLRCRYCDTAYAFSGGEHLTIDVILDRVASHDATHVTVTGGEPLAQTHCIDLLRELCDAGYQVSLETGGALDIGAIDTRVSRVVDLKTPASGELARNLYTNINLLTSHDQLKFVLCDRDDYDWAKQCIEQYGITGRCEILFSPSYGELDAACLADWILQDRLRVRMQLQLHKVLWGEQRGR
jgi:7-carboxy-7-deazaguanine synthase